MTRPTPRETEALLTLALAQIERGGRVSYREIGERSVPPVFRSRAEQWLKSLARKGYLERSLSEYPFGPRTLLRDPSGCIVFTVHGKRLLGRMARVLDVMAAPQSEPTET